MSTSLPVHIQQLTEDVLDAVQRHTEHVLRPTDRLALYNAIDIYARPLAHRIKAWLGVLVTQRVLPYWRLTLGEPEEELAFWESVPYQMVQAAVEVIQGVGTNQAASDLASHCQEISDLSGEAPDSPYYREWCVFEAGLSTLQEAIKPGSWQRLMQRYDIVEYDINYHGDTAKWAAIAEGGGKWTPTDTHKWFYDEQQALWLPHEYKSVFDDQRGAWNYQTTDVIQRRGAFWNWWLTEAIKEAWSRAQ